MHSRYYLETYGCSLNASDSDLMVGRLHSLSHERVEDEDEADVLIINTCGVKEPTEDRIIHRLEVLSKQNTPVIVIGCLPRISMDRVKHAIPTFAAILGPQSVESLGPVFRRVVSGERGIIQLESDSGSKLRFFEGPPDTTICTIPICEGCLGSCAYCAVRFARGPVRSYHIDELHDVVKRCVHLGYGEIRLTSQDASVFGSDSGETLSALLSTLDAIEGHHRFRLGMFNPDLQSSEMKRVLNIMRSHHFFRFFHIPVQSGSDSVLRAMNRKYSISEWLFLVNRIKSVFPRATIATDIIVGFPAESEDDFDKTVSVIESVEPTVVNISKYGDRPGTPASTSRHKVDTKIKKNRSRRLSSLVGEISLKKNEEWLEWSGPVLVTEPAPRGGYITRNEAYRPIILKESPSPGEIVMVEVVGAERTHLLGSLITEN